MNTPTIYPPIVGYVTPLSAQPGQSLSFRIASSGNQPFSARVVRIHCADPNPQGPGMKIDPVPFVLDAQYPGKEQAVHAGACALAGLPALTDLGYREVRMLVKPTLVADAMQTLCSLQDAQADHALALTIDQGEFVLRVSTGRSQDDRAVRSGLYAQQDRWQSIRLSMDMHTGQTTLAIGPVAVGTPGSPVASAARSIVMAVPELIHAAQPTHLCLGSRWVGHPEDGYNGLMEAPALYAARRADQAASPNLIAQWHLADDMQTQSVRATQPEMPELTLYNMPVRAVRSSAWTGLNLDWKSAPAEYAAIYFHADALDDCGWDESLSLAIPEGMASGVYGLEVTHPDGQDTIPFYVTPAADGPRARILFLAPTLTYQAYANHARGNYAGALAERIAQWGAYPHNPDVFTQFGASTYNRHKDMAGISLSSRLRPMLTMRPGYLTFPDPNGSGLRHFPADSHLTHWLLEKGYEYDVITDEDLDDQGLDALRPYDVVLTGSHPEYHTRRMIEALVGFREAGGYLMYLGANGFYWKIARPELAPHMLEIRRAEGGIRAWASEPGEYYNQLDGGYGGMWRRNGIAPQATGGVGFAVQGGFEGVGYRRTAESYDPDVSWLFNGITGETFGDYGLSGGGAAGFELDQVVPELGSPGYLKIVGVSENHGPSFKLVPEEILTWTIAASIPRKYEGVHAHMAVGLAEQGGGLFAVGSITFLGSLSHNRYDNDVSRVMQNCLQYFLSRPSAATSPKP